MANSLSGYFFSFSHFSPRIFTVGIAPDAAARHGKIAPFQSQNLEQEK